MNILPCPFCGTIIDSTDPNVLHPTGTAWIYDEELKQKHYYHISEVEEGNLCYMITCDCGAILTGDSKDDVIQAWNNRV